MSKTGIVILNYNSREDTLRLLEDIRRQEGAELRVYVVDNASTEPPGDVDGATVIRATENRGYNAGNNLGLRAARADGCRYALVANPDMRLTDPRYVATLVGELQAHPGAVVCASDIRGLDDRPQNPMGAEGGSPWGAWAWVGELAARALRRPLGRVADYIDRPDVSHECGKVSGCCLLLDLDWLEADGYFDEGVFLYCEEAILGARVARAGRTMWYTTATRAVHAHRPSAKGNAAPRFAAWRRSRLHYIRRYSPYGPLGRLVARTGIVAYTRLMQWIA